MVPGEQPVHLNSEKCKEIRISFARKAPSFKSLVIGDKQINVADSAKLLGISISNNLTWNIHIDEVIKKVNKRLYFLIQLKRAKVPSNDLALFYTTCIRSAIDYGIPVFFNALPQYLKTEILKLEKRAISIIKPYTNYDKDHHNDLCGNLF